MPVSFRVFQHCHFPGSLTGFRGQDWVLVSGQAILCRPLLSQPGDGVSAAAEGRTVCPGFGFVRSALQLPSVHLFLLFMAVTGDSGDDHL